MQNPIQTIERVHEPKVLVQRRENIINTVVPLGGTANTLEND